MIEGYFGSTASSENTRERRQRVMAVNAALEIIKAAVATNTNSRDTDYELKQAVKHIQPLADAIQNALK